MVIVIVSAVGCGGGGGGGGDTPITGEPVWNKGLGVIAASTMKLFSASAMAPSMATAGLNIKEVLARESFASFSSPAKPSFRTLDFNASAVWDGEVKFIYLDWEPLSGATYYQVYFKGADTDGTTKNVKVWDSRYMSDNDPPYATKAYLDLTDELSGKVEGALVDKAGKYQFQVVAYNNSYSKEYPELSVSIGRLLDNYFPAEKPEWDTPNLTWTTINSQNAGTSIYYKAAIYSDDKLQDEVWSEANVTSPAAVDTSELVSGKSYNCVVFGYADENGKPAEVTYSTSGFTY